MAICSTDIGRIFFRLLWLIISRPKQFFAFNKNNQLFIDEQFRRDVLDCTFFISNLRHLIVSTPQLKVPGGFKLQVVRVAIVALRRARAFDRLLLIQIATGNL